MRYIIFNSADFLICLQPSVHLNETQSAYGVCRLPLHFNGRIVSAMYCPPTSAQNQSCEIIGIRSNNSCYQVSNSNIFFRTSTIRREIEIFIEDVILSTSLTMIECIEEHFSSSGDTPIPLDTTSAIIYVELDDDTGNYIYRISSNLSDTSNYPGHSFGQFSLF